MDKREARKTLLDAGVGFITVPAGIAIGSVVGGYITGKPVDPWWFPTAIFLPLGLGFIWLARRFDKY